MAEAQENAKAHHNAFLDDAAKELLIERYLDLVFVDDVTELLCKRCGRVLIHHYMADCGHLFCRNCQRILCIGEKWKCKCPECREYIIHMDRQEAEVERRVNELRLYCPNHKYGCNVIGPLKLIPEHLAECGETREANLPALYDETNSNANIVIRVSEMSKDVNQLSEKCDQMLKLRAVDEDTRQQLNTQIDNMETIIKGSGLMTAKLQVEMANTFSRMTVMERETRQRSAELGTRLSNVEIQQRKFSESLKQNSEVFDHNRADYSQSQMDAMDKRIKSQAEDFDRQMNVMGENVNRLAGLSAELENKSADIASQQSAIKASFTSKFEELDENQRKYQTKLDELSAELKNELKQLKDEMRRTNTNKTSDNNLTMSRVPQAPRKPILTNEHGNPEYNILLLGPIGSGKSTFINSLANYLKFNTFDEALAGSTECLIPGAFKFIQSSKGWRTIPFGEPSGNEDTRLGRLSHMTRSKTKACKSYDFNYNQRLIRVIDSPGICSFQPGETRLNLRKIFESLRKYRRLHAITIVVSNGCDGFLSIRSPVEAMLSHLQQSAVANVIWLFTGSNNTLAESTSSAIKKMLSDIERKRKFHTRIPLNDSNSFHMDNRGFHHLILRSKGISEESKEIRTTWTHSVNECERMFQYVIDGPDGNGLQPQPINNAFKFQ